MARSRARPSERTAALRVTKLTLDHGERRPGSLGFAWEGLRAPVASVDVTIRHALGTTTRSLPAAAVGIRGPRGTAAIPIDLSRLPAGKAHVTITPRDAVGRPGLAASLEHQVPATGSTKPGSIRLTPIAPRLVRPRPGDLTFARFRVSGASKGGGSLFATIEAPDGATETHDFEVPNDGGELVLFAIGGTTRLGRYRIRATPVSADGTPGLGSETEIEIVGDRGLRGPSIDTVESKRSGAHTWIHGGGFDGAAVRVTIGGQSAPIVSATAHRLVVVPPAGLAQPADVIVTTTQGRAERADGWRPPLSIAIVPERFEVAEGHSVRLTAVVGGSLDPKVTWSVTGRGATIDRSGRVTAGFVRAPTPITVTARVTGQRGIVARAAGLIGPRTDGAAATAPVGQLGGEIRSADGGARLHLPHRALAKPTKLSVRVVPRTGGPARTRDPLVAGEVALGTRGLALRRAATLELPLHVPLPPGSKVAIRAKRNAASPWAELDRPGVVGANGTTVKVTLDVIPSRVQAVIDVDWKHAKPRNLGSALPLIASVGPNAIDEGATAALLVTGANFVPGMTTIQCLTASGAVEQRISLRGIAVTADGTRLGLSLKVGVMTDLGEGSLLPITLRVTTPAGTADGGFAVIGHDELDVLTGSSTLLTSRRFSRMDLEPGARLNVATTFPPITIECFERAYVRSTFDQGGGVIVTVGTGARGAAGDVGGAGGASGAGTGPIGLGAGGAGGAGANGSGAKGSTGAAGRSSVTLTMAGAGGTGGDGGGGGFFPHGADEGANGTPGRRSPFSPGLVDLAFEPSPGGGGGGGGGGEGWIFKTTGAGGGGGGAGGGALLIAAGEEITLQGDVVAAGGDGGFGNYPITTVSPNSANLIQAGLGGGGGGGAGGMIVLQGVRWWSGTVVAVGGNQGTAPRYGPFPVDSRTAWQRLLQQPQSGAIRIDGEFPTTRGGAFGGPDLGYVYSLLVTTPDVEVSAPGADVIRVAGGNFQQASFDQRIGQSSQFPISLFEGFNDVRSEWTGYGQFGPPILACAMIRTRRFLFLSGTIPYYEFACTVSPAAATVPTERTVQLSAAVTARPATVITWDVWAGGATGFGTVQANLQGTGAVYTAPCTAPPSGVMVRAISTLDPSRSGAATITVIPGIEISSTASSGTGANPRVPSVNVGQDLTIAIPAAVFALTGQGFGSGQTVEVDLLERQPNGSCQVRRVPIQGIIQTGMTAITVTVPPCAAPVQSIRAPGHGCLPIQVVPVIDGIDPDPTNFPHLFITGSGFACGDTTVTFISGDVAASEVVSVACDQIEVAVRPPSGTEVRVRTTGGTSAGFIMP